MTMLAANRTTPGITGDKVLEWGIMYPNMTSKYHFSFTGSSNKLMVVDYGAPLLVVSILLQLQLVRLITSSVDVLLLRLIVTCSL